MAAGLEHHSSNAVCPALIAEGHSPIHGRGVYAQLAIAAGERIIEYVGERISRREAARRERIRLERQRRGEEAGVFIFELNQRYALDGEQEGNLARLINHSCAPNCRSELERSRIWIVANRDINAGEELTFDYGYTYLEGLQHRCRCGSPGCAGYIISAHLRWRLRRARRAAAGGT